MFKLPLDFDKGGARCVLFLQPGLLYYLPSIPAASSGKADLDFHDNMKIPVVTKARN